MCPSAPVTPPDNIGLYWTDDEVLMYLERIIQGSSVPANVIEDVNLYQRLPSNLRDDIWYFIRSEQKKDSEHGFWKAKGKACPIITNYAIIGWRTTLEFHEGRAPDGQRTNWLMQEYRKGLLNNSNPKESSLLCRVFLSSGPSANQEMQLKLGDAEIAGSNLLHPNASVVADAGSTSGQGCTSQSQSRNKGDNTGPLAAAGELPNILFENMPDIDCIFRGDYLELNDLLEPESRCSSLDNTSCPTLTSDEYFDEWALMQDLEDEIKRVEQGKDVNLKFSIAASGRPNEVVMHPATLGSLVSDNGRKLPAKAIDKKLPDKRIPDSAIKSQKTGNGKQGTSNSHAVATSSSSHKAGREGENKARVGMMKKLKKYLCCMPF